MKLVQTYKNLYCRGHGGGTSLPILTKIVVVVVDQGVMEPYS